MLNKPDLTWLQVLQCQTGILGGLIGMPVTLQGKGVAQFEAC